ncbi:MAG: MerR family transcriptional regulator [Candidatus Limnocylindrales bacterium]
MLISELARRAGVSADTVRFYERAGWMPRATRKGNEYRDYAEGDVEHLRLLSELRRLGVPLADAARLAGWCHSGHCDETSHDLPEVIAARRADVAERMRSLAALDAELARLEEHLARPARSLPMAGQERACCSAAFAVADGCTCCSGGPPPS